MFQELFERLLKEEKQEARLNALRQARAPQGALTDHLSYLHVPIVGREFNVHAAHLQKATPSGNVVTQEDIEGEGLMIQGNDGHLYYQDTMPQNYK
jgi:hypothetical protein